MAEHSYIAKLEQIDLIIAGIRTHQEALAKRGIDAEFLAKLEGLSQQAKAANIEQERLKGELKKKTEQIENLFAEALKMHSEAKKMVKASISQSEWVTFGITDKQ